MGPLRGLSCVVFVVGCASSSDDNVDRRACEKLREHLVDLRFAGLAQAKGEPGEVIDVAAPRAAMMRTLGDEFLGSCQASLTPKQLECALAAGDSTAASACNAK